MTAVTIFMEGGGRGPATKNRLRRGMDAFLREPRQAASARSWRWQVVCCGDRGRAFKAFREEIQRGASGVAVLLVDSEDPVTAATFREHLERRDRWTFEFASDDSDDWLHLMVQTMETWIVADRTALKDYYGEGLDENELPGLDDLEAVSAVGKALERATRNTGKGEYRKIGHASDLLRRIDPETVRRRCPACRRLFDTLAKEIERQ